MQDPIVQEVREARDAIAADLGYEVHAIAEDARRRQGKRRRRLLRALKRRASRTRESS